MTLDQVTEVIAEAFLARWTDGSNQPLTPVTLDNETFTEPAAVPWVRLTVRENTSRQKTLAPPGTRTWERTGQAIAQVFAPVGLGGSKQANQLAEKARSIFEGTRLGPALWFRETHLHRIGPDGTWYQVNAEALFTFHDTH